MITIRIADPETQAGKICLADDARDSILHLVGPDCAAVHGRRIVRRECSVCGLAWGDGAYSQHERCALLAEDGRLTYADCIVLLDDGSRLASLVAGW